MKKNELIDLDLYLYPVEGGELFMGDVEFDDEKPAHHVRISGFYIGKFPVTQRLWQAVMDSNPARFKGELRPVENVSWEDAQDFITELKKISGKEYRLPTEAEWEFAARGGIYSQSYTYAGSDQLEQVGWYRENSDNQTHEVGQLLANELGLHDMSGNVWEWCQDWFSDIYYEECHKRVMENPQGPDSGSYRVLRGGGWSQPPVNCRSVNRDPCGPGHRSDVIGFRVVLPGY